MNDTIHHSLFEDGHWDDSDQFDHDDYFDYDHDHPHFDPSDTDQTLANLKHSLHGSELRIGKHRRVQGSSYAFWVDIYVEIDYALCSRNGETCANGIGPKTLNYGAYLLLSSIMA